jgi:histidinol-phosphate/aromatic aminotransferase/cobyric acid decarboxylase-like protein
VTACQRDDALRRLGYWTADAAISAALDLCRGVYQRDVVLGAQAWSGADLRGRAREYSGRYKRSREALLKRMRKAGIPVRVETVNRHGKLELVWGTK